MARKIERNTRQKDAIRQALQGASVPLNAAEVLEAARGRVPSLSLATVYRVLKQLVPKGDLAVVQLPGEVPLYEVAGKSHHHFFRCRRCGHMYQIEGCESALKPLVPNGFKMEDHELFLFGLCAECR